MNTEYIECIDEIVIKNPHGCSMMRDIESISSYDHGFYDRFINEPEISYIKSETVTINGYFNDGTKFTLEIPVDIKKEIKMVVEE